MGASYRIDFRFAKLPGIMKTPLVILLIVALVLAQGLRLCVHAHDAQGAAHAGMVHYESDSSPEADDNTAHDFDVNYLQPGVDSFNLLTGLSTFVLLLFSLLILAGQKPPLFAALEVRRSPHGFQLRPPLRAPPR